MKWIMFINQVQESLNKGIPHPRLEQPKSLITNSFLLYSIPPIQKFCVWHRAPKIFQTQKVHQGTLVYWTSQTTMVLINCFCLWKQNNSRITVNLCEKCTSHTVELWCQHNSSTTPLCFIHIIKSLSLITRQKMVNSETLTWKVTCLNEL